MRFPNTGQLLLRAAKECVRGIVSVRNLSLTQNAALMTFDDGPHPIVTPQVLELLQRHSARAVFFVVGSRIQRAPHLLKEILDAGHIIGNHTYAHKPSGLSVAKYVDDVHRCQEAIRCMTGYRPWLFRPPEGRVNVAAIVASRQLRLRMLLWNCNTGDWRLESSAEQEQQTREVLGDLESGARNRIVLMHDDNTHCPRMLERVLDWYTERGYDLGSAAGTLGPRKVST